VQEKNYRSLGNNAESTLGLTVAVGALFVPLPKQGTLQKNPCVGSSPKTWIYK